MRQVADSHDNAKLFLQVRGELLPELPQFARKSSTEIFSSENDVDSKSKNLSLKTIISRNILPWSSHLRDVIA